ncbi:MAG: helix-turn-helix transcriptional regulator [Lachnospiraceae bacterium]|nr:helix-turn-helix transcriptional regulator [Lachnospiraceae bacterium]
MKSCEELVAAGSEYFVYSPSMTGREIFLYPLQCGRFIYLPGYHLVRESFDSLLLLYVEKGALTLVYDGQVSTASSGSFLFIDCYRLHEYYTEAGCECLWCHFEGITAKGFYQNITAKFGNVFQMLDAYKVVTKLQLIIDIFEKGRTVREPLLSKYLNDILTAFLLYSPVTDKTRDYAGIAEDTITYINEHFAEDISIETLAERASISPYHFIRTFKKETGFTPHEYIINTRMATARYLLKNTKLSIKDICFQTGFSSESVFCSAFKKKHDMTPARYRSLENE